MKKYFVDIYTDQLAVAYVTLSKHTMNVPKFIANGQQ